MGVRLSNKNIVLILYCALLSTKLLSYVDAVKHSLYTPCSVAVLGVLILFNIRCKRLVFKSKSAKLVIAGFLCWILWGFSCGLLIVDEKSFLISHMFSSIVFYLNTFLFARMVSMYRIEKQFIKLNAAVLGIFLLWRYIVCFNGLDFINSLANIMNSDNDSRYRYTYGLYHANGMGNVGVFFLTFLFLAYLYKKKEAAGEKSFTFINAAMLGGAFIALIMVLSTASRSAITAIAVFAAAYIVLENYSKSAYRWRIMEVVLVIAAAGAILYKVDIEYLLLKANRLYNFTHNLPLLSENDAWITGLGFLDSNYFGSASSIYDSIFVDNFYLYVIMSTGIVGCLLIFVPVGLFVFRFFRKIEKKDNIYRGVAALLVTALYTSIFETSLLYPVFISSMAQWILFLSYANGAYFEVNVDENKYSSSVC